MSEVVLKVENVYKQYRLGVVGSGTLKDDLQRFWSRIRGKDDPLSMVGEINQLDSAGGGYVWALKDINFEVKQGEVLGIIGKNGAGKSTLLKILSKVTGPTQGKIYVDGRIASLLEVGTGFHPELTGRENIFLNGAILGMKKREMTFKLDEIVEFAGVEKYLDTPVKRYSSGMYVRLAFAVAAHLEPEILIVDEVLAVGDAEFQKRAIGKMQDVSKGQGRTVLFVSHNMGAVQSLCDHAILLENGVKKEEGKTKDVIIEYLHHRRSNFFEVTLRPKMGSHFTYISTGNSRKELQSTFQSNENIYINLKFNINNLSSFLSVGVAILNDNDEKLFTTVRKIESSTKSIYDYWIQIPNGVFFEGLYHIDIAIFVPNRQPYQYESKVISFRIEESKDNTFYTDGNTGVLKIECNWVENEVFNQ